MSRLRGCAGRCRIQLLLRSASSGAGAVLAGRHLACERRAKKKNSVLSGCKCHPQLFPGAVFKWLGWWGVVCLVGWACFVVVGFVVACFFSVLFVVVLPCRYQSPDCDLSVLYRIKTENKNM